MTPSLARHFRHASWLVALGLAIACAGDPGSTELVISEEPSATLNLPHPTAATSQPSPNSTPDMNPAATVMVSPTTDLASSATPERIPANTPTMAATRISVDTPTIIWTVLPTLPATSAARMVEELLRNNAGCLLPCWWGIYPGQPWATAQHFLAPIVSSIGQGGVSIETAKGIEVERTNFSVKYPVPNHTSPGGAVFSVTNNQIEHIWVRPALGLEQSYQLHQLLSTYGAPSEVYLQTSIDVPVSPLPFRLALWYAELGVLALYEFKVDRVVNEQIWGCPEPVGPQLWLWAPEDPKEFYDFLPRGHDSPEFLPLESATGMDPAAFLVNFSSVPDTECIKTDIDLWT